MVKKKVAKKKPTIRIVKKAKVSKSPAKSKKTAAKDRMNTIWTDSLLKDPRIRKWLIMQIGEHAIHVIQEFDRSYSDEDIAKKADIRSSDARVVLNRLHVHGLATYTRSRDKNSGWYSYIWSLDHKHARELLDGMEKIQLHEQEAVQDGEFYYSVVNGKKVLYSFEQAYENHFKCPISGQDLKYLEAAKKG